MLDDDGNRAEWRARDPYGSKREWVAVQDDGTIPIDIQLGVRALEVEGHGTNRWSFAFPKNSPDGLPLHVQRKGLGVPGILHDWAGDRALQNVGVIAYHLPLEGEQTNAVACTTDSQGRFELLGLEDAAYELTFRFGGEPGEDRMWWDHSLGEVSFIPSRSPSTPPIEVDLRLPQKDASGSWPLPSTTLSGRLRLAGQPAAQLQFRLLSFIHEADGVLRLLPKTCTSQSDSDGAYRVIVPRASRYRATFFDWQARHSYREQEWTSTSESAVQARDFDLE